MYIDNSNKSSLDKLIKNNYANVKLYYVNEYDNYYIFISDKKYGVLDKEYNEILLIDKENLCKKKKKYDIIYRKEKLMYLDDSLKNNKLTFNYYDINNCKLIESISVGG